MKITLDSGEVFEGTVEEFKLFYKKYQNQKLIDIIFENDSRKSLRKSNDSVWSNKAVVVCKINEDIITLTVSEKQTICISTLMVIGENHLFLNIENFNSNNRNEKIVINCNDVAFNISIDKHQTTRDDIFILESIIAENAEKYGDNLEISSLGKKLAKPIILTTLNVLNSFMERHSSDLSMKKFGYLNF